MRGLYLEFVLKTRFIWCCSLARRFIEEYSKIQNKHNFPMHQTVFYFLFIPFPILQFSIVITFFLSSFSIPGFVFHWPFIH
ncbi:MAG: hypothetical protein CVU39_19700 [Chloroflexi bacterium HGW-Chloroflexi-10]|nr:MAG: hypothetical protein CVU39_19700 [Chloroflexi bacterium HGW-Chloroflexi-10]